MPFSLLYGAILWLRNRCYDTGLLSAVEFDVPTIAVGNLSVGGTGKTPHVEYLIRLLKSNHQVATLSRGYNRRTRGYVFATAETTAMQIGDEPMAFHRKFSDIAVCVGEDRVLALPQLLMDAPETEVVLLDDAFQHRSIKPGYNILLSDYHHLFTRDHVVPFGRLREGRRGYRRADCIIISKCPAEMSPAEKEALEKEIKPLPNQPIYFSTIAYGDPYDFFTNEVTTLSIDTQVLLVCGIARPKPLQDYLQAHSAGLTLIKFPDHYYYTNKDIEDIAYQFEQLGQQRKIIITTEKDAVRLQLLEEGLRNKKLPLYVLPVEIKFLFNAGESFNNHIFEKIEELKGEGEELF